MLKVLFLEDDPDQLFLYQKGFEMEDIEMIGAKDSKEVREKLFESKPDLMLVDILLKDENGLDIVAKLKDDKLIEDVPVLIFTNYEKKDFRLRAEKLGAIDYFLKVEHEPEDIAKKVKWIAMAKSKN